jgi:hypothetical protein
MRRSTSLVRMVTTSACRTPTQTAAVAVVIWPTVSVPSHRRRISAAGLFRTSTPSWCSITCRSRDLSYVSCTPDRSLGRASSVITSDVTSASTENAL